MDICRRTVASFSSALSSVFPAQPATTPPSVSFSLSVTASPDDSLILQLLSAHATCSKCDISSAINICGLSKPSAFASSSTMLSTCSRLSLSATIALGHRFSRIFSILLSGSDASIGAYGLPAYTTPRKYAGVTIFLPANTATGVLSTPSCSTRYAPVFLAISYTCANVMLHSVSENAGLSGYFSTVVSSHSSTFFILVLFHALINVAEKIIAHNIRKKCHMLSN